MIYSLVAFYLIAGAVERRELATGLTWQQCQADKAAMPPAPLITLACEAEI